MVEPTLQTGAYKVELADEDGQLLWKAPRGADFKDSRTESNASAWLQLLVHLIGPLAPDEML